MKEASMELEKDNKLQYVNAQIEEMQRITWRNEVDIYINKNATWDKSEKSRVNSKIDELEMQNDNLKKAIEQLNNLKGELENE